MLAAEDNIGALEAKAACGDLAAFGAVIRSHDHDLRGVAWSIVRDASKTDDVMQDTYEKAFKAIDTFDGRSSMKTWLHSICYRTAIDHGRRESIRRHDSIDGAAPGHLDGAGGAVDSGFTSVVLAESLEQLDPESRAVVMLSVGYGYTYEEVATMTGLERGTVSSRLSRAKAKLRALYQEGV